MSRAVTSSDYGVVAGRRYRRNAQWIRRTRSVAIVVVMALFPPGIVGCGGHEHVMLSAPETTASLRERVNAYINLAPGVQPQPRIEFENLPGNSPPSSKHTAYLVLANGQHIFYAEDLLPVIPPSSTTAEAARKNRSSLQTAVVLNRLGIALGVLTVGTALLLGVFGDTNGNRQHVATVPITFGIGTAASLSLQFIGYSQLNKALVQADRAFLHYDQDLRERLDVCPDETRWVSCSSRPPPGPPGAIRPLANPTGIPMHWR